MRVVATLSSLPGREDLLLKVLEALNNQTRKLDAIYLGIAEESIRLGEKYNLSPEHKKLCTVVKMPKDYGPISKLYGALWMETDPETVIISVDDDVAYAPNIVEKLVEKLYVRPNVCICGTGCLIDYGLMNMSVVSTCNPQTKKYQRFTGFNIPKAGRNVDCIYGFAGVLYLRKFFPSKHHFVSEFFKYSDKHKFLFLNDDIVISGWLCMKGIKRVIFNDIPVSRIPTEIPTGALSSIAREQWRTLGMSLKYCRCHGLINETEYCGLEETISMRIVILLLLIAACVGALTFGVLEF